MRYDKSPNYMKNVSECILRELGKRNISQSAFADFCGVSARTIENVVEGRNNDIRVSTLAKIAEGIGVPLEYMLAGGTASKNPTITVHCINRELENIKTAIQAIQEVTNS